MYSIAVVGAGHLGRIHARLLAAGDHADLTAIVDPIEAARNALAEQHGVPAVADWRKIVDQIDAAIIAAPTVHHAELAIGLIQAGKHVLVEKPLAFSQSEADAICQAAEQHQVTLQTGHCERFNPAIQSLRAACQSPQLIRAEREGPYSFRSTDIGVVFDLMIHDIDLALSLIGHPVTNVQASGGVVIGPYEDWAQARLQFANGAIAELSACRTAIDPSRRWKVQSPGLYAEADLASGHLRTLTPGAPLLAGFDPNQLSLEQRQSWKDRLFEELLVRDELPGEGNAILTEQIDFVQAAKEGRPPRAPGREAAHAVEIAESILEQIHRGRDRDEFRKAG